MSNKGFQPDEHHQFHVEDENQPVAGKEDSDRKKKKKKKKDKLPDIEAPPPDGVQNGVAHLVPNGDAKHEASDQDDEERKEKKKKKKKEKKEKKEKKKKKDKKQEDDEEE